MRPRTRARAWTLQILYAWESRDGAVSLSGMLADFLTERRIARASQDYLLRLIGVIDERLAEIDRTLQDALTNWRLERLSRIDRNVLRIGAAELLALPDVPARTSIQEAILLAEKYGSNESPRFVNGVLDAVMKKTEASRTGARL
jgi:N utilization substance protein B